MALSKRTDMPIDIRKKISENILRLRTDITCAIKYRKSQNVPLSKKISGKVELHYFEHYNEHYFKYQ